MATRPPTNEPAATHQFRDIVDTLPCGVVTVEGDGITYANAAALRLVGASGPEQILGTPLSGLFPVAGDGRTRARFQQVVRDGGAAVGADTEAEDTLVGLDGRVIDVAVGIARLGGPGGRAAQVVFRDITERKRQDALLRENEERLRLAFAGSQEGVWDWNLETGAVVYSPRWKQMLGYGDDEIAPHVRAWEQLLHPDDKVRAEELTRAVERGERYYEEEFRLRHKDGHFITVLTRGLPIRDEYGRVTRIVGTHLDITERKRTEQALRESEERLALAFEGAQEGIWDWNLLTNHVVYSSRWKQMLGYADDEIEPHISAWERLVHPEDRVAADRAHEEAFQGQQTYESEFRLRHKDGHYVHVLSRGFPVRRDPGGPVVRIVGTHFDLTERRKREAERARNELLAHLVFVQEDERRRIARDMHDQFGEQLTALSLRIGLLKDAAARGGDVGAHVEALTAIAERLDQDVDSLVWQLRPTALDDLGLRAALANYIHEWSQRAGIKAELHTSGLMNERLAPEVETALYRIAQEALNNVAKHSKARSVDVLLERRTDCVLLIVEDDGIGFTQGAERSAGGGFGLVGMQERATLVGASLQVESSPGSGTTILVRMAVPAREGVPGG